MEPRMAIKITIMAACVAKSALALIDARDTIVLKLLSNNLIEEVEKLLAVVKEEIEVDKGGK